MKGLDDRIRKAREEAGFRSCAAGARYLRIPQQTLSDYERGHVAPRVSAVRIICRRFKVSADWLLGV